jgi:nitronate monooxygenase
VIQGGMGIAVSNWELARAVSLRGQLGVVSGTAVDSVLVRRLQDGDIGGHVRRAMEQFPWPSVVEDVLRKYFNPKGREAGESYKLLPMYRQVVARARQEVTILANFVEVWLAKEGHDGEIGINLLTKVQMPNLPSLYGAMLAGVDYVLMGAGIPKEIPGALDRMAVHEAAALKLDLDGATREDNEFLHFDPAIYWKSPPPDLKRPKFLAIVSAGSLANMLARKANGYVDGFVVEGPTAGGHNAPPRGGGTLNEKGEPIYTERDVCDLEQMRAIGRPFWLAGGTGSPDSLRAALDAGAAGIQVGTLFAYCAESGIDESIRTDVIRRVATEGVEILTDGRASPTGYPFKVVQLSYTNASREMYEARERVCDLGYLRTAFRQEDGRINYRCAAEPVDTYVKKGGAIEDTVGRKCLCNALMADIGMGQTRDGIEERPIVTSGDEVTRLNEFLNGRSDYSAADVLEFLMAGALSPAAAAS